MTVKEIEALLAAAGVQYEVKTNWYRGEPHTGRYETKIEFQVSTLTGSGRWYASRAYAIRKFWDYYANNRRN